MSADMAAGIAFAGDLAEVPEGYEIIEAGGKALHIEHYGAYDKVAEAHYAMDDYMKEKGLELNEIVVEEYVTDPTTVQDPSEILTNIYYFVK
jgi:effector-binding domain-containing protein